jgi:hypothetical protein
MRQVLIKGILSVLLVISLGVDAKTFSSQYAQFELPSGWQCALEGTEWVCQASNKDRQKEAIIIMAAKIRGNQDSLPEYQAYLKKTKTFTLPGGKTQVSEPKYAKMSRINNHQWVDSLHLASEVPGFYTRYMATVKADLGVAVTFSVAKDHYESYQPVFDQIIKTLRVFRQKADKGTWVAQGKQKEDLLGGSEFLDDDSDLADIGSRRQKKRSNTGSGDGMIIWIILAAVGAGVVLKLKGKKGKKKKKKSKK